MYRVKGHSPVTRGEGKLAVVQREHSYGVEGREGRAGRGAAGSPRVATASCSLAPAFHRKVRVRNRRPYPGENVGDRQWVNGVVVVTKHNPLQALWSTERSYSEYGKETLVQPDEANGRL